MVAVVPAVRPTVPSPAPAARGGEEAREERVELRDPILGALDDYLLVGGGGGWIGIHLNSCICLRELA
jgi:hypothetical protein